MKVPHSTEDRRFKVPADSQPRAGEVSARPRPRTRPPAVVSRALNLPQTATFVHRTSPAPRPRAETPHLTAAAFATGKVEVEHPRPPLRPAHRPVALSRCSGVHRRDTTVQ